MKNWKELTSEERRQLVEEFGWAGLRSHAFYGPQVEQWRQETRKWVEAACKWVELASAKR